MATSQYPEQWLTDMTDLWAPPTWFDQYGWYLLVIFLFIVFISLQSVRIYRERACQRRRRDVHMEAVRSLLGSFPSPTFSTDEEVGLRDTMCTICLCDFTDESVVSLPECGHIFHSLCIESYWIRVVRGICPNCRHEYILRGDS